MERGAGAAEEVALSSSSSGLSHRLQPFVRDESEQFQRRATRVHLTPFPLTDEPGGDIEIAREHGLARLSAQRCCGAVRDRPIGESSAFMEICADDDCA